MPTEMITSCSLLWKVPEAPRNQSAAVTGVHVGPAHTACVVKASSVFFSYVLRNAFVTDLILSV